MVYTALASGMASSDTVMASANTSASIRSLRHTKGLRLTSPKMDQCGRRTPDVSRTSSGVARMLID